MNDFLVAVGGIVVGLIIAGIIITIVNKSGGNRYY